ncbi:MAG: hypothetical protein Q9222_003178 [Ikaeria aurantiellina]
MPFASLFPDVDIPKINLFSYLFPDKKSLTGAPLWIDAKDPTQTLSAVELLQLTKRLGAGFDKLGIQEGEVILVFTPNHVFLPATYLAIIATGRIFSGANPVFTPNELAYQLKDTAARLLLTHPDYLHTARQAAKQVGLPTEKILLFSEKENASVDGILDWRTIWSSKSDAEHYQLKRMDGEAATKTIAAINYSSGTTGLPKGVCVSHYNFIANIAQTMYIKKTDPTFNPPTERWIGLLPLYHVYGQLYTCLACPKMGIPVYLMKQFNFEDMLWTIQTHKVTRLQIAPPVMVLLGKRPETSQYNLKSLRDITCGAAPLSGELQMDVSRMLNVPIKQGWGMTEATCGGINSAGSGQANVGSVGSLFSNLRGQLVDDNGREVPAGQPGELWLQGPNVMLGYWKNEKATKETITPDGWLKTGDVVVMRNDSLYIVDRKKELIKVKGFQVAPAELEAVLLENDDIADVAVVGMHISHRERPRAYIMLKPEAKNRIKEDDIHEWIRTRVAPHKYLTGGIAFVDEVPKSASGKILRKILKEWAKRDAAKLDPTTSSKL